MKRDRFSNCKKSLWIIPTLGTLLLPDLALAQVIDWDNITWTPATTQETLTLNTCDPIQATVSLTGDTAPTSPFGAFPNTAGIGADGQTLVQVMDDGDLARTSTITFTFTQPVRVADIRIHDIDANDNGGGTGPRPDPDEIWVDQIEVTGSGPGGALIPTLTPDFPPLTAPTGGNPNAIPLRLVAGGAGSVIINGNVATGVGDANNDTNEGTITASFGDNLVSQITVVYRNTTSVPLPGGTLTTNPTVAGFSRVLQGIGIGDVDFANACIGVAKQAGTATEVSPGVYTIPYTINVQNLGNRDLSNIQVTEDFATQFGFALGANPLALGQYRIVTPPATTGTLAANPGFDGSTDTNLLNAAGSTLAVGATHTIALTIEVRPDPPPTLAQPALLNNQVAASGLFTPPGGGPPIQVSDNSNNGTDPDPDGNGSPGGPNDVPTRVSLPPGAPIPGLIGVAKAAGAPVPVTGQPGVFDIAYTIVVSNAGDITLNEVQVEENFAAALQPGGTPDPIWSSLTYTTNTSPAVGQYTITVPPAVTGSLTTANAGFTGSGAAPNINLLGAGNTLTVGQSGTITFTARVRPDPAVLPGDLNNQVRATGTDPDGRTVEDNSVNGANPDADGNLDPRNDTSPTPVSLPGGGTPTDPPRIGVAKGVGLPRDVGNGVFEVPYTIRVQNYGGVDLTNVQVTENFAAAVTPPGAPDPGWSSLTYTPNANPAPGQYTVSSAPAATGTLTGNGTFTGSAGGSTDLLNAAASNLAVGQSETINFLVRVNPVNRPVTLNNQVQASGIDPNNPNTPVTDDSADDANNPGNPNPDANNDGDPTNDTSPTPVQLPPAPTPRIGVAKSVTNTVDATPGDPNDGLFNVNYSVVVANAGNVDLTNVQLADDLASQFGLTYVPGAPGVGQYTITAPPATAAPLTANPGFTGSGANTGLLNPAGSTLAVGQQQTLTFGVQVNISPANFPFILDNQVQASGSGGGQTVTDLSDDGLGATDPNPIPGGAGNPGDNNAPTRVSLPPGQPIPRIGTAKAVNTNSIVDLGDGRFNVPYTITVENAGTEALNNVQVAENFEAVDPLGFGLTFVAGTPAPGQYTLIGIPSTSDPLRINPNFTGSVGGSINLLDAANSSLPIGESRLVNFVVQVNPTSIPVELNNQAQATGTGATSGQPVTDDSVDGLNTSPDGDLNPNNNTMPTSILLPPIGAGQGGNFFLVKRITGVTRNGQPIAGFDFSRFTDDPNDGNDNTLNGTSLTPVGLLDVPGLQSGDEVEYTIYYLSNGSQPVTNARVCDLVPDLTTFIPNSFGGDSGILLRQGTTETAQTNAGDSDRGQFFSPLAPVNSIIPPCPTNTTNPNGSVFVNLGDIPNSGTNQLGFVRFRVRLN